MYRLNYGNGQVFEVATLAAAKREVAAQREFDVVAKQSSASLRIQRYAGDGEWVTVR